jgi:hypothetical protein
MHYANRKYVYTVIRVINYRSHRPASSRLAVSNELFWLPGSGKLLLALSSTVILRSRPSGAVVTVLCLTILVVVQLLAALD